MTPLTLVVDGLATYRMTRLVTRDELTRPLREKYLEPLLQWDEEWKDGRRVSRRVVPRAAYLATCPWCLSVWAAAAVTVLRRTVPDRWEPAAQVLAVAALAGQLLDRDRS